MRELIELIETLNIGKLKLKELWAAVIEPGSKMEQLYDLIQSGQVTTDEEAIGRLYPDQKSAARFQSLKNKLKERLQDVVFLLDFRGPALTDRQKAHFECNKRLATAAVLLSKNATLAGIEMLELLLRYTQYFEFTDLTIKVLYYLRLHYGTVAGDMKKFESYRLQYEQYQEIWVMENRAEELYGQLVSHYIMAGAAKEELVRAAEAYFNEIEPMMKRCTAFRLHLFGRLLQMTVYNGINDYKALDDSCRQAIAFFTQKPYNPNMSLQAFYYNLAVCQIQLRRFQEGCDLLQQYAYIYEEGSFNWFKWQELHLLLAMHTAHFDQAFALCEQVIRHPKMSKQPVHVQESWKIYQAYTHFPVRAGLIGQAAGKPFKPGKFLNETPAFSRDKRGRNVPILIARMLYLLADQKRDAFIDWAEALDKYNRRHLKQGETFRSHCFIKMMLQIPAASFHPVSVARKTEKLLLLLQSSPLQLANHAHEIEIIPYETLWNMVTTLLDAQQQKRSRQGRERALQGLSHKPI